MKSKPNPTRTLIREYIFDLKGERRENLKEYKFLVKQGEFLLAALRSIRDLAPFDKAYEIAESAINGYNAK